MSVNKTLSAAALAGVCAFSIASPASARIRCEGPYQINSQGKFSTPYCEDAYLAQVARSYGSRVNAETLRQSVREKQSICQFVGADIRVKSICDGYREDRNER